MRILFLLLKTVVFLLLLGFAFKNSDSVVVRYFLGLEWHAPLVFVLLVPERASDLHLQILSELAQMFSDRELRRQLAAAPDALSAQRLIVGWQTHAPKT